MFSLLTGLKRGPLRLQGLAWLKSEFPGEGGARGPPFKHLRLMRLAHNSGEVTLRWRQ